MTLPNPESQPDDEPATDGGEFVIDIDLGLLDEAVAAVEKREAAAAVQMALGETEPIDLAELASVAEELALEIEFDENDPTVDAEPLGLAQGEPGTTEIRIRAMEAESERDTLRDQMDEMARVKVEIEAKLNRLSDKASRAKASSKNAIEAQATAEKRAKQLRGALEKQQQDVERLLKRRKQEQEDQYERGRADAVTTLVEVLDNLLLALSHSDEDPSLVVEGVQMVVQQFEGNLKRLGVQVVPSERGEAFDPNLHEAIANDQDSELEAGQIVSTVSRGYTMDGKLLRAARVCVASEPSEE